MIICGDKVKFQLSSNCSEKNRRVQASELISLNWEFRLVSPNELQVLLKNVSFSLCAPLIKDPPHVLLC